MDSRGAPRVALAGGSGTVVASGEGMSINDPRRADLDQSMDRVTRYAVGVTLAIAVALVYYGVRASDGHPASAGVGALVLLVSAIAAGAFFGFLFGVPSDLSRVAAPTEGAATPTPVPSHLLQIAEWLTRILVGATVTQLGTLRDLIQGLGQQASLTILNHGRGEVVLTAAVIYGAVFGFFVGHVSTRVLLNLLFHGAERALVPTPEDVELVNRRVADAETKRGNPMAEIPTDVARRVGAFDEAKLTRPAELRAWGLSRLALDRNDARAVGALDRALAATPGDRQAVESVVLAGLYAENTAGFTRAIAEATRFLRGQSPPTKDDANLFAYLACAHGQAYAETRGTAAATAHKEAAIEAARTAIGLDRSWASFLLRLAEPGVSSEDDLRVLATDHPALLELLKAP